ncbi:MAG: hypothetical protein LN417_04190 [Candidatus Thermoplasmatota archaeon]|nr:hypothetical protein [Candidatus Thermoplasmatota archaeon]
MKRRLNCGAPCEGETCFSQKGRVLYVRRQIEVPLPPIEEKDPEARALILMLRQGKTTRKVQRFVPFGQVCGVCGWIRTYDDGSPHKTRQYLRPHVDGD